jgi:nitroreductase
MDVFEAIKTMLAVREYQPRPVPDEVVMQIVEAARLTGSARNTQPWHFVVVRERDNLRRLGELASTGPYIANAALAIAILVPERQGGHIDGTRAAQDMMLAAWSAGVGSNWVGHVNTPEIRRLLQAPEELMVLTVLPFGYPAKPVGVGKKQRKPLAEVASAEYFGNSFAR